MVRGATSLAPPSGDLVAFVTVQGLRRILCALAVGAFGLGCGTVERGADFGIADVVYDEGFFYCQVEPMLFARRCGPGEPGEEGSCHHDVTSYRLKAYSPLVAESCRGNVPGAAAPPQAQQNYQTSQLRMQRDPNLALLLNKPTGVAYHPRVIFPRNSPEADLIVQWATQYSTQ